VNLICSAYFYNNKDEKQSAAVPAKKVVKAPTTATPAEITQREAPKSVKKIVKTVARQARAKDEKVVPTEQLVTFELDREEYASTIVDLREIIPILEITPIPGAPPFVRGIVNIRGQIVVVIDLEKRLGTRIEIVGA